MDDPSIPSDIEEGREIYARGLNAWLLDSLHLQPGSRVLELAGGTGELALEAAARVGPGGLVVCSDLRAERVAVARQRAAEAGVAGFEARRVDMLDIGEPAQSFDAVLCRWGFMFPLPPERAFAEACRVLRRGGWLGLAVWGDPELNPWTTLADSVLADLGHAPPDRSRPGQMLSLADPRRLESLLTGAGFTEIDVEAVAVAFEYPDADAYWANDVAWPGSPFAPVLDRLGRDELAAVRAELRRRLARFEIPGAYRLPGLSLAARARRSA